MGEQLEMDYGADEGAARERIKELELIIAAQEGRIEGLEDRLGRSEFVAEYLYEALGPANDDIRYDAEREWERSHGAT